MGCVWSACSSILYFLLSCFHHLSLPLFFINYLSALSFPSLLTRCLVRPSCRLHNYAEFSVHHAIVTFRIFSSPSMSVSLTVLLNSFTTPFPLPTTLICFYTRFFTPSSPQRLRAHVHVSQFCRLVRVEGLESLADGHICLLSNLLLCPKENIHTQFHACMWTHTRITHTHAC